MAENGNGEKKKKPKKPKVTFGLPPSPGLPRLPIRSPTPQNLDIPETIKLGGTTYNCNGSDFTNLGPLGRGAFGEVQKRRHEPTGTELAVKIIPHTFNSADEEKEMRDVDISMRLSECKFTIGIYGALLHEGDVWIVMELMSTSLDKFYLELKEKDEKFPEEVLRRIAFSVVSALEYLHKELRVIHRDVKPSNILANDKGEIKLCDFGVSGILVNSLAKSNVGTKLYMAPERIDCTRSPGSGYDVRSDVWCLGLTVVELAILAFPYEQFNDIFQMISAVVMKPSPTVPRDLGYSTQLDDFVRQCLMKELDDRPKYPELLEHDFLRVETSDAVVADFMRYINSTET